MKVYKNQHICKNNFSSNYTSNCTFATLYIVLLWIIKYDDNKAY